MSLISSVINRYPMLRALPLTYCVLFLISCSSQPKSTAEKYDHLSPAQFYALAKEQADNKNFYTAIEIYHEFLARHPYGRYAEQVKLDLAFAHYKNKSYLLAQNELDRFINLHPTHSNVDYAYYLRGLSHITEITGLYGKISGRNNAAENDPENLRKSIKAFKELLQRFPESRYASDAGQQITYLENRLAEHHILVAQHYLKIGAYVAAGNRAKIVIENYQSSGHIEEGLGIMLRAYQGMESKDLARTIRRILKLNFPDSVYLAQASIAPSDH